ncbi:type II toxin-antitoxin system VapC family toxin [Chloroflexus sp.]|uniref:type II toxin-antitoxin system VapC family toxin n=1 Tax=Chloroflexus sp. TaxID=1904827 RepID=UPI002ADE8BFE|nr:type II toxin-antitoxin system VapC family toxin [Chloroflexus sp.]
MRSDYLLLDTNIVSYIMKGASTAELYKEHLSGKRLAISFITVGELWAGAEFARWSEKRRYQLRINIRQYVVIPYDYTIAQYYGKIIAHGKRIGRPISCADAWIAACALRHDIPPVTHNTKDFVNIPGLHIISKP